MNLSIDYRENSIISKLKERTDICYTIDNLPIGDFIIYKDGFIKLIIERKTYLDLSASITDGRFREQKTRLLESGSSILYIIEGVKNNVKDKLRSACNGAIQNMIYKHNINVMFTCDVSDTIDNICMLIKKIQNGDILSEVNEGYDKRCEVKLFSKSDKINSNLFSLQLSVIPGVSLNISNKLSDKFKNMKTLIKYLEENNEESLSEIHITEKRKLGRALSKKIYGCLLN